MKKILCLLQAIIIFFTLQGFISCQNQNQIVEKVYTYGIELNIKNESSVQKSVKLITLIRPNENSTWQELKSAQLTIPASETQTLNVSNTIQAVGYDYSFLVQIDDEYKEEVSKVRRVLKLLQNLPQKSQCNEIFASLFQNVIDF